MAARASEIAAAAFDPLCPRLTRIAYRTLGSVADAEDVVQDAFLARHRWRGDPRPGSLSAPPAAARIVDASQSAGFFGRFAACPSTSAHSRTLMGTAPLGNPAASSELRLSVELGATETSTT